MAAAVAGLGRVTHDWSMRSMPSAHPARAAWSRFGVAAVLLLLVVAGCGQDTAPPGESPTDGIPTVSEPTMSPTPSESLPSITRPTPKTPPTQPEITVRGEVSDGVEAGCLVFRPEERAGETWELSGELDGVSADRTVTLRGHLAPDMASICQQGPIFVVAEVVAAG